MSKGGLLIAVMAVEIGTIRMAGPAVAQSAPMPASDFVNAAAQSDQYEIAAGQVATTQSRDPGIRAFAQQMIQDHTRTRQGLEQAARASGLPPPPMTLAGDQQKMLSSLQSLEGPDFDKAYARQQVLAHQQAVVVVGGYAQTGSDPNVRAAAQSALPTIQHHLDMARQMRSAQGGG